MPNFKPVQNTTLPEAIAEQILAQIASGHLKPGDRLPTETELMQQFSVGRSTLREALKSLAMAGLIETRRSAGTFVSDKYTGFLGDRLSWAVLFGEREVRDIVEVRLALEGQTAALAAERATPQQKEQLTQLVTAIEENLQDADKATEYDMAFHVGIAEASQNLLLLNLMLSIRNLIRDYIKMDYSEQIRPDKDRVEHRQLLEAIQAGQPDQARQAMAEHLASSLRWMLVIAREHSQEQSPAADD